MLEVVKSKDFFLQKSSYKNHPNLNNIRNRQMEEVLLNSDGIVQRKHGNAFQYTKTGYRNDIGINVRSSWEANFIRVLNLYKIKFDFEPTVFPFPVKRGTKAYTPDFFLPKEQEWVEIKGYLDDKSKIKLKRFKRYYLEDFSKLTCVISKYSKAAIKFMTDLEVPKVIFYEDIRDEYSDYLLNWEGKR